MMYNLCKLDKLTFLVIGSFLFPLKAGQYNLYQLVRTDIIYNFYNVKYDRIRKSRKAKVCCSICAYANTNIMSY
jgi:hypothetical protein